MRFVMHKYKNNKLDTFSNHNNKFYFWKKLGITFMGEYSLFGILFHVKNWGETSIAFDLFIPCKLYRGLNWWPCMVS